MSSPAFMPLFIGDYLADTMHLTRDQHGAYLLLIMAYWRNGGALPDDNLLLSAVTKSTENEWKILRKIVAPFFKIRRGAWHHKRIDAELSEAVQRFTARSNAGSKGAAKRWQSHTPGQSPGHLQSHPQSQSQVVETQSKGGVAAERTESSKKLTKRSSSPRAHAWGNGQDLEKKDDCNGLVLRGRSAPLRAEGAPLKHQRKEQLRQKVMRFANATMGNGERHSAIVGLMGEDPQHSAQWWLDHLDQKMRAEHWDDRRQ